METERRKMDVGQIVGIVTIVVMIFGGGIAWSENNSRTKVNEEKLNDLKVEMQEGINSAISSRQRQWSRLQELQSVQNDIRTAISRMEANQANIIRELTKPRN